VVALKTQLKPEVAFHGQKKMIHRPFWYFSRENHIPAKVMIQVVRESNIAF